MGNSSTAQSVDKLRT